MIIDTIQNLILYESLLKNLKNGINALKHMEELEPGRYEFEGGFFMVQKGATKPLQEGTYEAHRKYIDVQILLDGEEVVAWEEINNLIPAIAYDEEKDVERFCGDLKHIYKITPGMFYIAFPHDGHKANLYSEEKKDYAKIVMKLPVL